MHLQNFAWLFILHRTAESFEHEPFTDRRD